MARLGSIVNQRCYYCLCRYCTKVQCPRGRYHCAPCYHGQVLDCDFFQHRKMVKYFRIVKRSPAISEDKLRKLRDALSDLLDEAEPTEPVRRGTLQEQLKREDLRHKQELRKIIESAKKGDS